MSPELRPSLVCYPYYSSKNTGRGHDRYIFELYEGLKKSSAQVHPLLLHQGFSKRPISAALKQPRLMADLLRARADLYHAMSPIGGATAALLGKHPLVVTIHDLLPFHYDDQYDYGWKHRYYRLCTRISAKRSDAIIVPYEVTKRELVDRFGVSESSVHVVNYGVDHHTYFSGERTSQRINSEKTILYVGEVSQSKGVDALLRAYRIVERRRSDTRLLIGGKRSKDQPLLERLAHELGIQSIVFLGYIPEEALPHHYSTADVMVYPSRYGFGLSTLEAMACGTPVIVGAVLDAPEFVADAGVLVDPDNADQMAEAILRTISDPDLAVGLSKKAIERARGFSWDNTVEGTINVYRKVLA